MINKDRRTQIRIICDGCEQPNNSWSLTCIGCRKDLSNERRWAAFYGWLPGMTPPVKLCCGQCGENNTVDKRECGHCGTPLKVVFDRKGMT